MDSTFWPSPTISATAAALLFLLLCHLLKHLFSRKPTPREPERGPEKAVAPPDGFALDLNELVGELRGEGEEVWEDVVRKSNPLVAYHVKSARQKDRSIKYLSITTFEDCNPLLLRDFYMDNNYRKKWDSTVVEHQQLQVDEARCVEFGRTIKKFPFLTPREYVLVWRLWEGKQNTFYCLIKDCEHPLAPRQKKYIRVGYFHSGWRIRKVPGRNACEITMVHQENAGLNIEMAKLAFAKGIWSYVCKMNNALREYPSWSSMESNSSSLLKSVQVPPELESNDETCYDEGEKVVQQPKCVGKFSHKKWLAKGLLVVGGVVCLSRGHPNLATQLAMACFLKKLTGNGREHSEESELSRRATTKGKRPTAGTSAA